MRSPTCHHPGTCNNEACGARVPPTQRASSVALRSLLRGAAVTPHGVCTAAAGRSCMPHRPQRTRLGCAVPCTSAGAPSARRCSFISFTSSTASSPAGSGPTSTGGSGLQAVALPGSRTAGPGPHVFAAVHCAAGCSPRHRWQRCTLRRASGRGGRLRARSCSVVVRETDLLPFVLLVRPVAGSPERAAATSLPPGRRSLCWHAARPRTSGSDGPRAAQLLDRRAHGRGSPRQRTLGDLLLRGQGASDAPVCQPRHRDVSDLLVPVLPVLCRLEEACAPRALGIPQRSLACLRQAPPDPLQVLRSAPVVSLTDQVPALRPV